MGWFVNSASITASSTSSAARTSSIKSMGRHDGPTQRAFFVANVKENADCQIEIANQRF